MAHMLVQEQTHRTPNISMHQNTSTKDETRVPMCHTVDKDLFFYKQDPTGFLHFLHQFANEPQVPVYHESSLKCADTNSVTFPSSSITSVSNQSQEDKSEDAELNCDHIELIFTDENNSDRLDQVPKISLHDELNEDLVLNPSSPLNTERHFRRRKRRTSLTRSSLSSDDSESVKLDTVEKSNDTVMTSTTINDQIANSQDINEALQRISIESSPLNEDNEKQPDDSVENSESNYDTNGSNRFRGRRLRYRSHRSVPSSSLSQESISDNLVQFFVPTEPNHSPPSSPPPSPTSPTTVGATLSNNGNTCVGVLKRTGSLGTTTKKIVRFADSVGQQLAQVQYIQALTDDESQGFSLLKNNVYIPKALNIDHKPWSFDLELSPKQTPFIRIPKRFFCLYRQPNSDHPDVYLHAVWKSQVKVEYATVRTKSSLTGEQYLYGTVWVTNISYQKSVFVKYTFNRWLNTCESEAKYCCHSNDFRNLDQFEFTIDIPHDVDRIDFVLRYCANGQEHWDNNDGRNYTLETECAYTPPTTISFPHDCNFDEMRFY